MFNTRRSWCAAAVAALGPILSTAAAHADTIGIQSNQAASTEGIGSFVGAIEYNYNMFTTIGELLITLTNNSPADNGGFITGVVFNVNSLVPSPFVPMTSTSFSSFMDTGPETGTPYGDFDAGAALGGDWLSGGSPNDGIGVGQTGTFGFAVFAPDASSLMASDFLFGPNEHNFIVRFRGFEDGGSDKVPAMLVPAPGSMALLALSAALFGRRRRNRTA